MPALLGIIVALIVIGVLLYLFELLVPMDPTIKTVIRVLVFLLVFLWVISAIFGVFPLGTLRVR